MFVKKDRGCINLNQCGSFFVSESRIVFCKTYADDGTVYVIYFTSEQAAIVAFERITIGLQNNELFINFDRF